MDKKLSENVFKKDFQIKSLGYDAREVDAFLDTLNIEIERLERELKDCQDKINIYEARQKNDLKRINELQIQLNATKANKYAEANASANFNNIDMIQRLSNLENMVASLLEKIDKQ